MIKKIKFQSVKGVYIYIKPKLDQRYKCDFCSFGGITGGCMRNNEIARICNKLWNKGKNDGIFIPLSEYNTLSED